MTIEAHYTVTTAAERRQHPLIKGTLRFATTQNGHRDWINHEEPVTGKADAREFCARTGYTPWNF